MGEVVNITRVKFAVGELVHHRLFDYRGVVTDVDHRFQGSDEWYHKMAKSRPPKDRPWYHVLVHDASHTTYVAERNLEPDELLEPIEHPLLRQYFAKFECGKYQRAGSTN